MLLFTQLWISGLLGDSVGERVLSKHENWIVQDCRYHGDERDVRILKGSDAVA